MDPTPQREGVNYGELTPQFHDLQPEDITDADIIEQVIGIEIVFVAEVNTIPGD